MPLQVWLAQDHHISPCFKGSRAGLEVEFGVSRGRGRDRVRGRVRGRVRVRVRV